MTNSNLHALWHPDHILKICSRYLALQHRQAKNAVSDTACVTPAIFRFDNC